MNDEEVLDRWMRSTSIDLFERGQISETQFATAFIKEWHLSMTESTFLQTFAAWVDGCLDGAMALVKRLHTEYRVGCLSNTNVIHWDRLTELIDQFHFSFPSHITRFMKPERRAYDHVVETLGVQPQDIYFFDDLPPNIVAAREIGLNAFLVGNPREVESILQVHRLLQPIDGAKRNEFAR